MRLCRVVRVHDVGDRGVLDFMMGYMCVLDVMRFGHFVIRNGMMDWLVGLENHFGLVASWMDRDLSVMMSWGFVMVSYSMHRFVMGSNSGDHRVMMGSDSVHGFVMCNNFVYRFVVSRRYMCHFVVRSSYMSWLVMHWGYCFMVSDGLGHRNNDWLNYLFMILLCQQLLIKFSGHLHILANFLRFWLMKNWLRLLDGRTMSRHFYISNLRRMLNRMLRGHLDVSRLRLSIRCCIRWDWLRPLRLFDDVAWPRRRSDVSAHILLRRHEGRCAVVCLLID